MSNLFTAPYARPAAFATAVFVTIVSLGGAGELASASTPTPVSIAQIPLTIPVPPHPQVLFALANSQSMDGTLSGAIMTGSGGLSSSLLSTTCVSSAVTCGLQNSSSPIDYTVPAGFTAPVSNTAAGSSAPYTVTSGGVEYDNSNSRLNVAKGGIASILQTFLPEADFGLIDYQTTGRSEYTTWVYYMSNSGGFTFDSTAPTSGEYVANPCYNVKLATTGSNTLGSLCNSLNGTYANINTYPYMAVNASSDDPDINDVLYSSGLDAVFTNYGGPTPASEFSDTLSNYNNNQVQECYSKSVPYGNWNFCETPTNAGYVPSAQQVMQVERGFGFGTSGQTSQPSSQTSWPVLVRMTSAGQVPTQASMNTAIAAFTPYLAPETNSNSTSEIKAEATQAPIAGLLQAAGDYFSHYNPASSNGCANPTRYIVLVTDGLPTKDLSGHSWPPLGTVTATGPWSGSPTSVSATFDTSGNGALISTNDQALADTISVLQTLAGNGIKTYIIGVGAGVQSSYNSQAAESLTAMAVAGGTNTYFAATTEQQLNIDMQAILADIVAQNQSTASTAVNTTGLNNGSVAYLAQFQTRDTEQDWTGDLDAYPITPGTGAVDTSAADRIWSAQAQLDAQNWDTGRLIATWDPVAGAGIPFRWTSGTSATSGIASTTQLGRDLMTFTQDTSGQDVLNYLRGDSALEQRNSSSGQFRNRSHKLGDIVASAPVYVGAPQGFSQSASYFSFVEQHANRAPILYIGANDGMLHAFDAATGTERFAYIPNGVFANLVKLVNPYYNEQHQFYVNGTPVVADVQFSSDSSWHTMLVGTEGAGGDTLFGLDVSSADQVTTEAQVAAMALWEFTDTDMGYSFSEPAIADTNAGWLVFVGNGYDSPNQKPVLYALNPQTGAIVEKIDLCAKVPAVCNTSVSNGLSSVTVINSYGQSSLPADRVYAGDLEGNLWRIDITNSDPSQWAVTVILQATDSSGNAQPITTAPAATLNPSYPIYLGDMVFVGTGQLLGLSDLATTQVQTLYGVFDAPTGASFAAPSCSSSSTSSCALTRSNNKMEQQTMISGGTVDGVAVRVAGDPVNAVQIPRQFGWYVDFNLDSGERIVDDPQLEAGGGLIVTSYQPNSSECIGGGNSWLQVFNYADGSYFNQPELDVNGDGSLNASDQATGYDHPNPVGVSLGNVYSPTATVVNAANGQNGNAKLNTLSNLTVKTYGDRGRLKKRIGWWEIRH